MSKDYGFAVVVFCIGLIAGFFFSSWLFMVLESSRLQDRVVCVKYSQTTGDCISEMAIKELISNASDGE